VNTIAVEIICPGSNFAELEKVLFQNGIDLLEMFFGNIFEGRLHLGIDLGDIFF